MDTIEQMIQKKAYELGYEKCGIIPIGLMDGYTEKFNERIEKIPKSKMFYENQQRLAKFREIYPWAKSVMVLTVAYGKYKVPEMLNGLIAKAYLFDTRVESCIGKIYAGTGIKGRDKPKIWSGWDAMGSFASGTWYYS